MFLEQSCPGQANLHSHAIHTFIWERHYIVYATGSLVAVYTDPNVLVQNIEEPSEILLEVPSEVSNESRLSSVTAVAGDCKTGRIAVAYTHHIGIFRPQLPASSKTQPLWRVETVISTKSQVSCLDWSINGLLLAAGIDMTLWQESQSNCGEWDVLWTARPAVQAIMAKFESSSAMFATLGKFDRLVTVWHPTSAKEYAFIHLAHPRSVSYFAWKALSNKSKLTHQPSDCALFTMARDGIGRFWSSIDPEKPHAFYMCAVIDPNQSLMTSETSSRLSQDSNMYHADHIEDTSPIHYINCNELRSAVCAQSQSYSRHDKLNQRIKKVQELVRETPDLLFRVQSDGSLTFWGVKYLNVFPKRIPRVFVVSRIAQAIDPSDVCYFLNPIQAFYDPSSGIKPVELSLITQNPHGQIRCYGIHIVDFLEQGHFIPRLYLKYAWMGHKYPIKSISPPYANRLCSTGIDGEMNIWKYELRENSGKLSAQLQLSGSISLHCPTALSIPMHKDGYIAIYNGEQLLVYYSDNQSCHLHHYKVCDHYDPTIQLSSLHTESLKSGKNENIHILLGVSASSKKILSWKIQFDSSMFSYDNEDAVESNSLQEIIYLGSQTFDWEEIPSVIVTSYESSHQPISKILQKITTGINEKMRIAVCVGSNILFYGVELDPEEELEQAQNWHRLYTLETSLTDIRYIQFALNHVAIVSSSSIQGPMCHLSFWSEIRVDVSPTLYTSFEFSEPIIDIAWNVSCDAQYILAIAFAKKISVYGQKRTIDSSGYQDHWTCYHEFTVDMPNPIVGIAWLDNSIMAVASGNQLGCYLKWLISKNELTPELLLDSEGQPMLNIYDVSYHMNGPLPIYHPNSLIFYLMWGNTTLINYVLLSVYKFLRCYSEEDDIDQMPHFSFETIIKLQNNTKESPNQSYTSLFDEDEDEDVMQLLGDENNTRPLTLTETNYLISCLKSKTIPGLSQKERMHLVAMVDTFVEVSAQGDALDENGIRFTALLENHFHLQRILESQQQPQVLRPCDFIWALHSQSQDLLLDRCICLVNNKLMWENARSLGIFLWLRKIDTVRDQMSAIARNTYLSKEELKDPESCTLFYLALRKKNLLLGLWKSASFHKEHAAMCKFLSNDFTQPRWKTAASKNAFVLLGKQRYEYAAAFFLLADKIKDAVSIILKHMKDFQLAIAICRVYLGDNCSLLKEILENNVLSMAIEAKDRWLISIVYSLLERPHDAINATVAPLSEFSKSAYSKDESAFDTVNPNIFIIYNHLKQQLLVQKHQNLRITYDLEYKFSLKVAHAYERLGCPLLALYILTHYAEKPPTIESKFIEEDSSDIKISRAADLFDDETPKRPSYAANLFDDEAASQNLESKSVYKNQEKEDNTISDDHLASYKSLLITRTLQTVFRSISTMYDASDKSGKGSQFQSFLSKKIQDLFNLGEALKVPQKDFYRLLIQKSIETDTFILCLDMLENCVPDDFDMSLFLLSFEKECFQVFEVSVSLDPLDYDGLAVVEKWSDRVIATYSKWSQWLEDYSIALSGASLGVLKLVLINHICLILVTLKMRHFEKTWGLIYCLKSIVECMAYEKRNTYHSNIQSIYTYVLNTTKMTEMTTEDYDSFSDDSVFGFDLSEEVYRPLEDVKDDSIGSSLLELASLNYILYILESSMQATEKTVEIEGSLIPFLWTTILGPIAYRSQCLQENIFHKLGNILTRRNVLKQFNLLRQKKYWRSLRTLCSTENLLSFIDSETTDTNMTFEEPQPQPHTIYYSPTTAHSFCISSTYPTIMAVFMKSEIHEVNRSQSQNYGLQLTRSGSVSSSGLHREHITYSYPDTEDEEDEINSDSGSEVIPSQSPRHIKRREPKHAHHSVKPPNSSALVLSAATNRVQSEDKSFQSRSLENLQALKRSFGMDHFRSPGGPSSTSSCESKEQMITLKRHVSVTCAESHTQFPLYITGCDGGHGGPSAILWQFGQEKEITNYYGSHGTATRIHFDLFGQKFGLGDTAGALSLWKVDSHTHSDTPYYTLSCHSKATRDFAFLDSSSLIATVGTSLAMSRRKDYVCLWDSLLPPAKAQVCSLGGHDGGSYAVAFSANSHYLFSGGHRGGIVVSDIRQRTLLHTFSAHQSRIRSIAIDTENNLLITGSVDGELKIWDAQSYKQKHVVEIQPRNRFLAPTFNRISPKSYGVTQIQLMEDGNVFTSGPGGIIACDISSIY